MRILVAVPTLDRPTELRRCVDSIVALELPPDSTVAVLVVDNGSAIPARSLLPERVRVVDEPARGVASVRNRALDHADSEGFDLLAFIDDDETCGPDWLVGLVDAHRRSRADVVTGPVIPDFDGQEVNPTLASYFDLPDYPNLSERPEAYTGNVLFSRRCFAGEDRLRFDTAYNLTGGEDTDFTQRLHEGGCRIVWSANAIVHEHIPAERLRWGWVISRHIGYGERKASILQSAGEVSRLQLVRHGLVSVGFCAGLMAGQLARARTPLTMLRPGLFGIGCIRQAIGVQRHRSQYGGQLQ